MLLAYPPPHALDGLFALSSYPYMRARVGAVGDSIAHIIVNCFSKMILDVVGESALFTLASLGSENDDFRQIMRCESACWLAVSLACLARLNSCDDLFSSCG